jgi:hypothetical protein
MVGIHNQPQMRGQPAPGSDNPWPSTRPRSGAREGPTPPQSGPPA